MGTTWLAVLVGGLLVAAEPTITTAVGTGERGFAGDGGPAPQAKLDGPFDVAFDRAGNLYLSDTGNHRIRRVDARTQVITTVAGSGRKGFGGDGGPATKADLDEPYGLAIDADGSLVFADRLNRRIRRVDGATGIITTVAGTGSKTASGDGGPATDAGLAEPNGVAFDPSGNLLIADVADHRVRRVDRASGVITSIAGTGRAAHSGDGGLATEAGVIGARAVAVSRDGTIFVVERQGHSVRAIDPKSHKIRTVAGTSKKGYGGDGGPADRATFDGPKEIDLDLSGRVLVVDTENHAIRVFGSRPGATITTLAGTGKRGGTGDGVSATAATLDRPHGVAVAADGSIWIGDTGNHRIRRVLTREPDDPATSR